MFLLVACAGSNPAIDDTAKPDSGDTGGVVAVPECPEGTLLGVSTASGCVVGTAEDALDAFRGIPYAQPPVGDLRWKRTVPVQAWEEPLQASTYGEVCPQANDALIAGDLKAGDGQEDCLFLNVWRPLGTEPGDDLPVLFFIHGGGHVDGAGSQATYADSPLAEGAVVVTINYRLAQLGFLAHPAMTAEDPEGTSGNLGLFDTLTALQWVHDSARAFGGDPDQLMIFGESAGGVTTCLLLQMPQAAGLFSAATVESATCHMMDSWLDDLSEASWAEQTQEDFGRQWAATARCEDDDIEAELACMRGLSVSQVQATFPARLGLTGEGQGYGPTVDGVLVPEHPAARFARGDWNEVPVVMGVNQDEGTLFMRYAASVLIDDDETLAQYLRFYGYALGWGDLETLVELYGSDHYGSPQAAWEAFYGDAVFVCPVRALASEMGFRRYLFEQVPSLYTDLGSFHGAELAWVFGTLSPYYSAEEQVLSIEMQASWRSVAANTPTVEGSTWPQSDWVMWKADDIRTEPDVRTERCGWMEGQGWGVLP